MTFVSIILPYNKPNRYLKNCLDSLSEQNLNDSEVILIVNGSDEPIDDLIDEFGERLNIVIKCFAEELGVAKARNEGLRISKGKYVYFIDSDDYLYGDSLSKLVDVAFKTDADFINGERINTVYIKDRFEEQREIVEQDFLLKNGLDDLEYSLNLLVGTKTTHIELLSVLHSLIKKDIIGNLQFDENRRYLTDYEFILEIIKKADTLIGVENALYAKRNRDDPINFPSLYQEEKGNDFLMYYDAYCSAIDYANQVNQKKFDILKDCFHIKLLNYYLNIFAARYLNNPDKKWRNENFDAMNQISKYFDYDDENYLIKKEVQALQNKDEKKLRRYIKIRAITNRFKKMLTNRWMFKAAVYNRHYNKKPINENKIIFESFFGNYYSDSPKYLYEYLYENYSDKFEFVWVLNDNNIKIPGNPKIVKRFSLGYYKEMANSKYWVNNGRQPARLKKRSNQVMISTWHGTPLKKLGLDIGDVHSRDPNIKKSYIKVAKEWDYLISPNRYTTDILRSSFAYEGEILEYGYPRNDILYNATQEQILQIKKDLNLPNDKKIILYAPTWRDDEFIDVGEVNFELQLKLDQLQKELSDEYIVLIRAHYFIANKLDLTPYEGFAFDVTNWDDIAELYLISDILITDYSSVFFDFANLKRPILFYTYDLEKYENVLRGFYIDIHTEVPGPLLKTTEEVIDAIRDIDSLTQEYDDKYELFYERFCSIDDGNSSKRIAEKVWKL